MATKQQSEEWTTVRIPIKARHLAEQLVGKARQKGWESLGITTSVPLTLGSLIYEVLLEKVQKLDA